MSDSTDPFLLFLHVPKNGGTTLRSIVDLQYGPASVLTYYNQTDRQLLDNVPYMLLKPDLPYRALIGHFHFGVHDPLPERVRYVTLLREPIARTISEYHERLATGPTRAELAKPDGTYLSLAEALERYPEHYDNQQVRYIAGVREGRAVNEKDLARALANLDGHFAFVGTVERFDESLLLMGRRLGWRPCVYDRLNRKGGMRHATEQAVHERLLALNELDLRLYTAVAQRLDAEIAAAGPELATALAELNAALDQRRASHDGRPREADFVEGLDAVERVLPYPPAAAA